MVVLAGPTSSGLRKLEGIKEIVAIGLLGALYGVSGKSALVRRGHVGVLRNV
jgi:hypothetical protein